MTQIGGSGPFRVSGQSPHRSQQVVLPPLPRRPFSPLQSQTLSQLCRANVKSQPFQLYQASVPPPAQILAAFKTSQYLTA